MEILTTFCPRKIVWELTYAHSKGKDTTSKWLKHLPLIKKSLVILKNHGISGIRLVIFSFELTKNGHHFDFKPLDIILKYGQELDLDIQLCLGPYQYPYSPGVRLPADLLPKINQPQVTLDENGPIKEFGIDFLKRQLERYGDDQRITGFYLGNEWPDKQKVEDKEGTTALITEEFMIEAASLTKDKTQKSIYLNTNIDAFAGSKIKKTFKNLFQILKNRGRLGLDLYPSRQTWPQKQLWTVFSYPTKIRQLERTLTTEIIISELEAQPWGKGQPWFEYLKREPNPHQKVLNYRTGDLKDTWDKYLVGSDLGQVNLWGADFWLVCHTMGIKWPLEEIKRLSRG